MEQQHSEEGMLHTICIHTDAWSLSLKGWVQFYYLLVLTTISISNYNMVLTKVKAEIFAHCGNLKMKNEQLDDQKEKLFIQII